MRARRAFSLVEALLSFLLFLLVLSLVAQGFGQLSQITRFFDARSRSFSAAHNALQRMASEAQEATNITLPAAGDTATYAQLKLNKVDPAKWPVYYPAAPPSPWNPRDPSLEEQVNYALVGPELHCFITTSGTQDLVMAEEIQGLTVRRVGEVCLEIRLSVLEAARVASFTRLVYLPQSLERTHP